MADDSPEKTLLIVGLGNPGEDYELTPHNLGFMTVDRLAARHSIRVTRKEASALVGLGRMEGKPVILAKPQTYMNLSGPSIKALLGKYELGPENLLLVYDELDLPWGQLRIRPSGSAAGHNGMRSTIGSLGTDRFARLRMGIHPGHPIGEGARFVLAPVKKSQFAELDEFVERAAQACESIAAEGVEKSMTKFNRRAQSERKEEE
ncbi:MAG: aminoacyl-tRNA hydrolase [Bryobacteraceae bacterium]